METCGDVWTRVAGTGVARGSPNHAVYDYTACCAMSADKENELAAEPEEIAIKELLES